MGQSSGGVFAEDVRAVAARVGVAQAEVHPVPLQGQVNFTVFLSEELVLRLPRTPAAAARLATEAQVMPLAHQAGVPTPQLIAYDPSLQVASRPYMLLQRVHGATLAELGRGSPVRRRALTSLGQVLADLHQVRLSQAGPIPALSAPYVFSAPELLEELVAAGEIGAVQREWLLEQFALLQSGGPSQVDPVLLHRDVIPSNVVVDSSGQVQALLDWGSAEWGSAARDLVGLPLADLPDLLRGYRLSARHCSSGGGTGGDLGLERDALWYHLYLGLARLVKRPSTSQDRNWAAPRSATLLDVLAFSAGAAQQGWPARLRRLSLR